jgi:pimeloyl-ACP methyl ester carboxylesterase
VTLIPAVSPMVSVDDDLKGRARCLVVFLPGVGDVATDFEDRGFVESPRARGLRVDVSSAQATLAYDTKGTVVQLGEDVVSPARRYREAWRIGLSMGGLGTLLHAHDHPTEITGVLALAPFPSIHPIAAKIRAEGGLVKWKAPEKVESTNEDTTILELWRWLQALTAGEERGPKRYPGRGTPDEAVRESNEILALTLPMSRRFPHVGRPQVGSLEAGARSLPRRLRLPQGLRALSLGVRCALVRQGAATGVLRG